jgi:hypothetical protein
MTVSVVGRTGLPVSYFALTAARGNSVAAGKLVLRNQTRRTLRVALDPVDALTASTLGSAYAVRGKGAHGATRWTRLPAKVVTVAPRGSRTVAVNVAVPKNAPAGDHLSGIGVQALGSSSTQRHGSNLQVSSVERYAIGVEVTVPGPRRPHIALTGARLERRPTGLVFLLAAANRGNTVLQNVKGAVLVTRGSHRVARSAIGPGTFVNGTTIQYPIPATAEQPRAAVSYRVQAVMRYRGGVARLDRTVSFGARQAKLQAQFGGPRAHIASSKSSSLPLMFAFAAGGALAVFVLLGARRFAGR